MLGENVDPMDIGHDQAEGHEVSVKDESGADVKPQAEEEPAEKSLRERYEEIAAKKAQAGHKDPHVSKDSKPESADAIVSDTYQPSFKYKAYDKEFDMPEWTKNFIKDKETEEQFQKLFSKSEALEPLKKKHDDLRLEREAERKQWAEAYRPISEAQYYLSQKDYKNFFKSIQLPDDEVIGYVKNIIAYHDMTPEQRQIYDRNSQQTAQSYQAQSRLAELQEQNAQLVRNQHEFEYSRVLAMPEVQKFREAFDARLGEGAFRRHADQYGDSFYWRSGGTKNTTPLDAVSHVMNQYKGLFEASGQTSESAQANTRPERPSGVIPNVGRGKSASSPMKKRFRSVEDLRNHYKNLMEQEAEEA